MDAAHVKERQTPKIVLATHGGCSARGASRLASLLAQRAGAEIDVVGVLAPVPPMDSGFGLIYPPSEGMEQELEKQIEIGIAEQLAHCGLVACQPKVRLGQPAIEIAAAARTAGAALIVLGLGPHHAVDRALAGETALQLVQVASTPVLAAPVSADMLPRRALVAIDFTPTSMAVAQTVGRVMADDGIVELVHVSHERHRSSTTEVERRLSQLADAIASGPLSLRTQVSVVFGAPAPTLLDMARSHGVDVIALGSHGYGLWKRLTIGSVASKIIRLAEVSVLVQPLGSVVATSTA